LRRKLEKKNKKTISVPVKKLSGSKKYPLQNHQATHPKFSSPLFTGIPLEWRKSELTKKKKKPFLSHVQAGFNHRL
jgi:hypothetical protein